MPKKPYPERVRLNSRDYELLERLDEIEVGPTKPRGS